MAVKYYTHLKKSVNIHIKGELIPENHIRTPYSYTRHELTGTNKTSHRHEYRGFWKPFYGGCDVTSRYRIANYTVFI